MPVPDEEIDQVHELASAENQPMLLDKALLFEWAPGLLRTINNKNGTKTT